MSFVSILEKLTHSVCTSRLNILCVFSQVMVSMEADSVQTAFSAPLPIVPLVANSGSSQLGGEEEGLPSPGLATFTASQSTVSYNQACVCSSLSCQI